MRSNRIALANDRLSRDNIVGAALVERLREAIGTRNQAEVAEAAGVSSRSLSRYLSGEDVKLPVLSKLADATGVTLEWLATGRGGTDIVPAKQISAETHLAEHRYIAIPRYNVQASAGGGSLAEHPQIVEYMAYDEHFLSHKLRRNAQYLLLVEARGDSMEPSIKDGDVLTVDITPGQKVEHGALYVLRVGDNLLVKRVEQRLTSMVLHSENPRYGPETIAARRCGSAPNPRPGPPGQRPAPMRSAMRRTVLFRAGCPAAPPRPWLQPACPCWPSSPWNRDGPQPEPPPVCKPCSPLCPRHQAVWQRDP